MGKSPRGSDDEDEDDDKEDAKPTSRKRKAAARGAGADSGNSHDNNSHGIDDNNPVAQHDGKSTSPSKKAKSKYMDAKGRGGDDGDDGDDDSDDDDSSDDSSDSDDEDGDDGDDDDDTDALMIMGRGRGRGGIAAGTWRGRGRAKPGSSSVTPATTTVAANAPSAAAVVLPGIIGLIASLSIRQSSAVKTAAILKTQYDNLTQESKLRLETIVEVLGSQSRPLAGDEIDFIASLTSPGEASALIAACAALKKGKGLIVYVMWIDSTFIWHF